MKPDPLATAYVIKIGSRYFCRFGKGRRVMTAWSLAGATTFLPRSEYVEKILQKLVAAGKAPELRLVTIVPVQMQGREAREPDVPELTVCLGGERHPGAH
ncbi:hypothetical protein [Ancylobacter oerskovii]|uniref:Uncharacterized protein n=2 Tax=Ancylobacter oerskovii TaxID=459519 RepID=A0ABW4YR68_9HYPH